jgi:hypothetical protein
MPKLAQFLFVLILIPVGIVSAGNVDSISPIKILRNADLTPPGSSSGCRCATLVNGTWVIGPWSISGAPGDGVYVDGVTLPFVLQNLTITKSVGAGIHLKNLSPATRTTVVTGVQTSIQNNQVGILVESSSNLILDGGGSNPNGPGVRANGSVGTINKNRSGAVDVENSSSVTVKGWQTSTNGADGMPAWISFNPDPTFWNVGGVRFFNVTDSVIDHNAANNDTSISYSLFASADNSVTWNTADYPFSMNILITAGSIRNVIDHNQLGTADFIGIMVADPSPGQPTPYGSTRDNTISNNIVHSSGPTGGEVMAGMAPDFIGGIVLLNSTSGNHVIGNQLWSNLGTDLKWAAATVDPTSPIGVRYYPNTAICNVPLAPFNGNQWSGNVFRTEDVCAGNIPLQ